MREERESYDHQFINSSYPTTVHLLSKAPRIWVKSHTTSRAQMCVEEKQWWPYLNLGPQVHGSSEIIGQGSTWRPTTLFLPPCSKSACLLGIASGRCSWPSYTCPYDVLLLYDKSWLWLRSLFWSWTHLSLPAGGSINRPRVSLSLNNVIFIGLFILLVHAFKSLNQFC